MVSLVVIGAELDLEHLGEPRRGPKVAPLVFDARVAVELLKAYMSSASEGWRGADGRRDAKREAGEDPASDAPGRADRSWQR